MSRHRVGLLVVLAGWCFFFGAGVCLEILGWFVCWIGGMKTGGEFSYGALRYEAGKFIFFDARFSSRQLRVQAPKAEVEVSFGHSRFFMDVSLVVERPDVALDFVWPEVGDDEKWVENVPKASRWIDWRCKCIDGNLSWPSMGLEARMTWEKTAPCQLGRLMLEKGDSCLELEVLEESGGMRMEAHLVRVDSSFFQPWLKYWGVDAKLERGEVDGWVHIEAFEGEGIRGCAHMDVREASLLGFGGEASVAHALLDWDGPLKAAIGATRIRCECESAAVRLGNCGFQEISGQLSYYSDLGIKWEGKGSARVEAEVSPVVLSSKGFWSGHSKPWFLMECLSTDGKCTFRGDFTDWTVNLEGVRPFWGRFAQEFCLQDPLDWAFLPCRFNTWEWKEGEASCAFHWNGEEVKLERFVGTAIALQEGQIRGGCDQASVHFDLESSKGVFSLEGLFIKREFAFGGELLARQWRASGEIQGNKIESSEWKGQIEYTPKGDVFGEPMVFGSSFSLSEKGQWLIEGQCSDYPFSLEAKRCLDGWSLACKGGAYSFPYGISLEQIAGHLMLQKDGWAFDFARADLKIGHEPLQLQVVELMKTDGAMFFDLRAARGFWDVFRFVGKEKEGIFELDCERTEILGQKLQMGPWNWKQQFEAVVSLELPWDHLLMLEPFGKALGFSLPASLASDISGSILLDFQYIQEKECALKMKCSPLFWKRQPLDWSLQAKKASAGWNVHIENEEPQRQGSLDFSLVRDGEIWFIQKGRGEFSGQISCHFSGQCDAKGRGQASFTECSVFSPFLKSFFSGSGKVEGKGCLSFDLSSLKYEVDGDISRISLESGPFSLKNTKPVHAFFSPNEGLMLQGIEGQVGLSGELLGECQINLLHWEPSKEVWMLAQSRFHCLEEAGTLLFKEGYLTADQKKWDPRHEMDLVLDLEGTSDFSEISCFMKEGFVPLGGQLRHVHNASFRLKEDELSCDLQYIHQGYDLNLALQVHLKDTISGFLKIQEPEAEAPLTIDWRCSENEGLAVDAIQGNLAGVSAFFYTENSDTYSHLIGSANIDFRRLAPFLPSSVAEVFTELEMGKGYEIQGKLQIDKLNPSRVLFQGLLSGKEVELFGYAFQTCLANLNIKPDAIQIDQLKISDPAGLFTFDRLTMGGEEGAPWTFHIPLISISEFRPTLLQAVHGDPRELSPLVIRTMIFRDMKGILEESASYTAEGELYFINSYKRERTIFDIPSEVLGRIIGLDIELLVPVCGKLSYVLEKGKFHITSLKEAYSQGSRSQFFLVPTAEGPSVDLDGNVQIQVKMKQYVLFKLTEAFSIFIDGTLKKPQYHLQKNKK